MSWDKGRARAGTGGKMNVCRCRMMIQNTLRTMGVWLQQLGERVCKIHEESAAQRIRWNHAHSLPPLPEPHTPPPHHLRAQVPFWPVLFLSKRGFRDSLATDSKLGTPETVEHHSDQQTTAMRLL